jgi:NAD(P)-dependent dehydrogenase (short-subunit alcohol dehydrogenase family)
MNRPDQRIALVTGANRGIGTAIARQLAALGDIHVLAAARDQASADESAAAIGGTCSGVLLDLSSETETASDIAAIRKRFGQVNILINNAGVLEPGGLMEIETDMLDHSLRVNLLAPIQLIRAFAPDMARQGYGRIVNVSSGWGSFHEGLGGPSAYAISKAALNAMTLSLSKELPASVKINAACPGWVRTRMGGESAPRTPDEGADTPVWLATLPDTGPTGGFFRDRRRINW